MKVSLAVTHQHGLMVGARSFTGNPYDGHTLAEQMAQTNTLLQGIGVKPATAIVVLGYQGLGKALVPVEVIHRGKFKSLTPQQKSWLNRRPGDRAVDRAHEGRSPHGPVLAQRG